LKEVKMRFITLCLVVFIGIFLMSSSIKSEQIKFERVFPFISPSGLLCLFDQRDGKIYIYDTNFSKCNFVLQLKEVGEPLERIK